MYNYPFEQPPFDIGLNSLTVTDRVYKWIKDAIINGALTPGERIVQEQLTQQLRVSRTPVRDALQRLSTEGLVVIKPFYGAMVFELSDKDLSEIYELRILLEQFAAQKEINKITEAELNELEELNSLIEQNKDNVQKCMFYDREFHYSMCSVGQSNFIIEVLTSMWNRCDPYKSFYYTIEGNIDRTIAEHAEMIRCFREKDIDGLKKAIDHHLSDVVRAVSSRLKKADETA